MPSILTHLLLPHESNNHRPKALHIDALFFYLILFVVFRFGIDSIHRNFPDILGYATDIHIEQLLSESNKQRRNQGLSELVLNEQLSAAASQKAADMFANNYWAHNSPQGKTPWDFIVATGYRYNVAGENLAKNFSTSPNVVDAWMASPSHRDNLLKSSYQEVGFAVVNGTLNGEETTLVVQMFGSRQGQIAAKPQPKAQVVIPQKATAVVNENPIDIPVEVQEQSQQNANRSYTTVASAFASVTKNPIINIPTISRELAFIFLGIMMGLLTIDAIIVSRKRVIRIGGHNIAHLVFLIALTVALTLTQRGSLL